MQPVQHSPDTARGLAATVRENAIVRLPELVFVEPPPNGIFFDVKDEFRRVFLELHDVGFDDRRNTVATRSHP